MYITTKELQERLSVCKNTAVKLGDQAEARVRIGSAVRWDWEKIQEFIRKGEWK